MPNRKITCEPHPLSNASEGPIMFIPDTEQVDVAPTGSKLATDVVPGDRIFTYKDGPAFVVISNVEATDVTS